MSLEEWRTIFSGCTLISVVFVVLNFWLSQKKQKNDLLLSREKEICEQAVIALERAYSSLNVGKNNYDIPDASRLNWLTSSRQIIRFEKLKELLETEVYQLVCSEHEEYWRHEFYLCLNHHALLSTNYYQSNNIHLKSALIIFNFKQWGPDTKDPIDDVDGNEIVNDGYTLNGQHGLKMCIDTAELTEFQ